MIEDERQIFHIFLALCSLSLVLLFGVPAASLMVAALLLAGLVLVHAKLSGRSLGALEALVARFERHGVTPGYGALTIAAGTLAILTLISKPEHMLASLAILGFGDAASTLAGMRSRQPLPYNRKKTWGGTLAFFLASAPAFLFAGWPALAVAAAAAIAESLESKIDDNLTIAVVCVICFRLFGG